MIEREPLALRYIHPAERDPIGMERLREEVPQFVRPRWPERVMIILVTLTLGPLLMLGMLINANNPDTSWFADMTLTYWHGFLAVGVPLWIMLRIIRSACGGR